MTQQLSRIRDTEFPWTAQGEQVYLNHAGTGPMPARTLRALAEFDAARGEPWRIVLDQQFGILQRARAQCARLIGADATEIALTVNTSTGTNLAARALPIPKGKVVLGTAGDFPANVYPWMALERSGGARYRQIPVRADGLTDTSAVLRELGQGDVGLVALSWVSFHTGQRVDLARIGAACRAHGAFFVVDAIQGVGVVPLDVRACQIDMLACGSQKWLLSPWGSGFCYIRRELIERCEPMAVGWIGVKHGEDFSRLMDYDLSYAADARRFELSTLPYQDMLGMNASLDLLFEVGVETIAVRVGTLTTQLIDGIAAMPHLTLLTPRDAAERAGIVTFGARDLAAAGARLRAARAVFTQRDTIRLAPHFYNTVEEIETVLSALA